MAAKPIVATFVSDASFTVVTDRTAEFVAGVRVLADCGADGTFYGTVSSASYASGTDLTTVTLSLDSGSLTANLTGVLHGNDVPASLVNHGHGNQADGGALPDFIRRDNSRAFTQGFISGEGAYTGFKFTETGADVASNAGKWIFQVDDGMFSMLTVDDAESAFNSALTINRDGASPSAVTIAAPYVGLDADDVEAAGNIVPPASDPGSLGTSSRPWGDVRTGKLLGVDVSGGTVDALVTKASAAEAVTGTDATKAVTAAAVRQAVLSWVRDNLGKFPGIIPPSLNLFCGDATSDAAPVGTFARSTTGARLGQAGLIETVAAGGPRREWDSSGNLLGWLIEKSDTNKITYSEQLGNAVWKGINATVSVDLTVSPDGNLTADKVVDSTATSGHLLRYSLSLLASTKYTCSFFAKKSELTSLTVLFYDNGSIYSLHVNLGTGASAAGSGSITSLFSVVEKLSNGWYKISFCVVSTGSPTGSYIDFRLSNTWPVTSNFGASYTGDGASGLYLWGVQVEAGNLPTSYIPTTSAAVARSSDVWTVPLATSWFSSIAGTSFVAARTPSGAPSSGAIQVLAQYDDDTASNRIRIVRDENRIVRCIVTTAGTEVVNLDLGTVADLIAFRAAFSWSSSGFSASLNGAACVTATAATLPSGLTTHHIGSDSSGASQWGGHILHSAYFPVALSDTQLQAITL